MWTFARKRNQQLHWFRQLIPRHDQIHALSVVRKSCFPLYWSFQGSTFRWQQNFGRSNTLQAYIINVSIYALSVRVTLSVLRRVLLKEKLCVYWEQTSWWNFRVTKARICNSFTRARLPSRARRKYFSRSKIFITNRGSPKQNKKIQKCFAFHHEFQPSYA